jgi:hypothetical protein
MATRGGEWALYKLHKPVLILGNEAEKSSLYPNHLFGSI